MAPPWAALADHSIRLSHKRPKKCWSEALLALVMAQEQGVDAGSDLQELTPWHPMHRPESSSGVRRRGQVKIRWRSDVDPMEIATITPTKHGGVLVDSVNGKSTGGHLNGPRRRRFRTGSDGGPGGSRAGRSRRACGPAPPGSRPVGAWPTASRRRPEPGPWRPGAHDRTTRRRHRVMARGAAGRSRHRGRARARGRERPDHAAREPFGAGRASTRTGRLR